MRKIIQILTAGNKLLGLSNDGTIYVEIKKEGAERRWELYLNASVGLKSIPKSKK